MEQSLSRKLTAILYADVAGYSRLTGEDEVAAHRQVMRVLDHASDRIRDGGGTVLRYAGDAILAEFPSLLGAVETAADIQTELAARNRDVGDDKKTQIRIGLNLGEVIQDRDEIYGDGVNLAARLEAAAQPGGICISAAFYDQIAGKTLLKFSGGGEQSFKNIARPVRVYHWQPANAPHVRRTSVTGAKPSIAVLPFVNMSGDAEQEYFADGITEDLITALSRIRSFLVIARNSTFTYKGQAVDIKRAAADLGVRYVLEGSVRTAGSRVRITAQLIDAESGHHVWAERYDRELTDIFELQDEMTQIIAGTLEPELNAAERERALRRPPDSLDAWSIYQRALWHMYGMEPKDNPVAIDLFRQSIAVDPNFAPAYAYLCYTHYQTVIMGWGADDEHSLNQGMEAAQKALTLDPKDSVAYFALGRIQMLRGQHDESIASLEKAIELNPNSFQAYHGLAMVLTLAGRLDEAKEISMKGEHISPRDPLLWAAVAVRSLAYLLSNEYDDAIHLARRTQRFPNPSGYWPHALNASASAQLGQMDAARNALKLALEKKPDLSLSYLKKTLPTKDEDGLEVYLSGLRKAGLPES